MTLRSSINKPEIGQEALEAFKQHVAFDMHNGEKGDFSSHYEHGQWWITCLCGGSWSVVDSEGGESVDGFDFERISEGDDDYHLDAAEDHEEDEE
jgi:hypothetical protein